MRSLLREGLALEWQQVFPHIASHSIASVYFGGGTPSLFGPEGIAPVLERIPISPQTEITIEANPEECTLSLLKSFRDLGINRISFGVQSLDDSSLQTLGRLHSARKAKSALFDAAEAGFQNISIDLMFDLPDQTEESFRRTLNELSALPIQHVSLYNLTVEPHTVFFKQKIKPLSGERSVRLLNMAVDKLESLGFYRYEISAFAKPGFASIHNTGYWTGRPFWGLGPSAFSFWNGERFRNVSHLHRYVRLLKEGKSPIDFREKLPSPADAQELLAIGLRRLEGIPLSAVPPISWPSIEKLIRQDLLEKTDERLCLTKQGLLFYDTVATELIG